MTLAEIPVPPLARLLGEPLRWLLTRELAFSDRRVRELVTALEQPQNLVSYHLRQLREGGMVTARRSSLDARDTYYSLDLVHCAQALAGTGAALHPGLTLDPVPALPPNTRSRRRRVLFVCTGNSSRSPMAAALLQRHAGAWVHAASAGSHPKPIHLNTARVMRERYGIDLTGHRPTRLDTVTRQRFDYVISLCDKAREACPEFPARPGLIHWSLPDPAATEDRDSYAAFVRTAVELETRIRFLLPVLAQPAHTSSRKAQA